MTSISHITLLALLLAAGCTGKEPRLPALSAADSATIIDENLAHRDAMDLFFQTDPSSPFMRDTSVDYNGIRWFPINPLYRGTSMLHRYANPETVIVMGTKGEARRELRYAYFEFPVPDVEGRPVLIRLNAYKFTPYDADRYHRYRNALSVAFTDETTGKETYDVGRYLDVGDENPDPTFVYTLDLNKTFNPYCAYSNIFSCAVPRDEDHIPVPLRVGEMRYHESTQTLSHH